MDGGVGAKENTGDRDEEDEGHEDEGQEVVVALLVEEAEAGELGDEAW